MLGGSFEESPPSLIDLAGSTVVFRASYRTWSLVRSTADGTMTIDPATGILGWTMARDVSLLVPLGRLAPYRYDVTDPAGLTETYLNGYLIGKSQ